MLLVGVYFQWGVLAEIYQSCLGVLCILTVNLKSLVNPTNQHIMLICRPQQIKKTFCLYIRSA